VDLPPNKVIVTHEERSVKREYQQDATIRCLSFTSVSICFGHHYTDLQVNKCPVTAFGVYWSVTSGKTYIFAVKSSCGAVCSKSG